MSKEKHEQLTLSADEATVQERQVTIRVLTIGTKQITQTLYRQLIEEDVIDDETGCLKGDVWGWVNLHVDCDMKMKHLHAIWEDRGQLKRSCVRPFYSYQGEGVSDAYYYLYVKLRDLATVYICLVALVDRHFNHWDRREEALGFVKLPLTIKDIVVPALVPRHVGNFFNAPAEIKEWKELVESSDGAEIKEFRKQQVDRYKESMKEFLSGGLKACFSDREWEEVKYLTPAQYISYEDAYKAMEDIADKMNTLKRTWQESFKTIEQSGQLFVAVSGVWK